MSYYTVALFLHVTSAVVLVGGSFLTPVLIGALRRARTAESLRTVLGILETMGKAGQVAGPAALITGLYMATVGRWWGQAWVTCALVLFVVFFALMALLVEPRLKPLAAAIKALPDGPVSAEVDSLRSGPVARTLGSGMLVTADVAFLLLMTTKPGWTVSLAILGTAAVVSFALSRRPDRTATPVETGTPAPAAVP